MSRWILLVVCKHDCLRCIVIDLQLKWIELIEHFVAGQTAGVACTQSGVSTFQFCFANPDGLNQQQVLMTHDL